MEHYMGLQKKIQDEEKEFQLKFTFSKSTSYWEFKTGFRSSVVYVVQKWSLCTLDQAIIRNPAVNPKNLTDFAEPQRHAVAQDSGLTVATSR